MLQEKTEKWFNIPTKKNEEKDGSNFWKKQTETLELKKIH